VLSGTELGAIRKARQEAEARVEKLSAELKGRQQTIKDARAETAAAKKSLQEVDSKVFSLGLSGYGLLLVTLGKAKV
jgi:chromosome segregation ATPase